MARCVHGIRLLLFSLQGPVMLAVDSVADGAADVTHLFASSYPPADLPLAPIAGRGPLDLAVPQRLSWRCRLYVRLGAWPLHRRLHCHRRPALDLLKLSNVGYAPRFFK